MKIRIAFLIDEIESPSAGTEKQLIHLIEGLDRTQFEPVLCVLRSTPWSDSYASCPVHAIGVGSFKRASAWHAIWQFSKYLQQEKIHCIQTHFRDSSLVGVVAAKFAGGIKVIQTRKNQGYWMKYRDLILSKTLNRGVSVFVSNSYDTCDWVTAKESVSPDRIRMIYNGLDFSVFPKSDNGTRQRMRRALGLGENGVGVVLVANLRPVKRADVFVDAAARVLVEDPGAVFFLVGDGLCRESLVSQAADLGISRKVRFMGKRTDIPDLLSAMDIGVLTSDSESFPNSLLEYMAAGLTVVSTDVGGCHEIIGGNGFGSLVSAGDSDGVAEAIHEFCQDKGRRQSNRIAAPEAVRSRFSMDRYISSYERLYKDIVHSGGVL